jgi:hypothetical protein
MRYAYERADGGVSIIRFAPRSCIEADLGKALDEIEYRSFVLAASHLPREIGSVVRVDQDIDPALREALVIRGGRIEIDLDKARRIAADRITRGGSGPMRANIENELAQLDTIGAIKARMRA